MEAVVSPETLVLVSKNIRRHMSEDNRQQNEMTEQKLVTAFLYLTSV